MALGSDVILWERSTQLNSAATWDSFGHSKCILRAWRGPQSLLSVDKNIP